MGKKEGGKGGNHKGKQQLRLGGKKVAAGACIIVENYECRRPFAVFFLAWAIQIPIFFGSQGKQRKICGTNAKNALFGNPIDRSSISFLRWLREQGEWGMKGQGVGKMQTPLSLSLILSPSNS